MENGKIMYSVDNGVCFLKFVGRIACRISCDLDSFLSRIVDSGSRFDRFILDLTETTYIDSTNLGMLAKVHHTAKQIGTEHPVAVSVNDLVEDIFSTMGFDVLFSYIAPHHHIASFKPELLHPVPANADALGMIALDAHRRLSSLNPANEQAFRGVVECLERDLFGRPCSAC